MTKEIILEANIRLKLGTGKAKMYRKSNLIPATIYNKNAKSIHILNPFSRVLGLLFACLLSTPYSSTSLSRLIPDTTSRLEYLPSQFQYLSGLSE